MGCELKIDGIFFLKKLLPFSSLEMPRMMISMSAYTWSNKENKGMGQQSVTLHIEDFRNDFSFVQQYRYASEI